MKRVRIDRPGRSSYWQTEELECPCCHQPTRREFEQPALIPGRPAAIKTDCLNPQCPAYYATLGIAEFEERFGTLAVYNPSNGGQTK